MTYEYLLQIDSKITQLGEKFLAVHTARQLNLMAYDDDMAETWKNFKEEAEKLVVLSNELKCLVAKVQDGKGA